MLGVVERVDDEVRRAGVARILGEHSARDRGRERLSPEARIAGPYRAQQRQGVPSRDLVIVGPARVQLGQILGVRAVARELVVGAVVEEIDRLEQGALLRQSRFRDARCACRCERFEHALSGLAVLLRPERVVVAHRLAPVGEREARVEGFGFAKRDGGFVELEAVQRFDAFEEFRLRGGYARGLERDRAELLRVRAREGRGQQKAQ